MTALPRLEDFAGIVDEDFTCEGPGEGIFRLTEAKALDGVAPAGQSISSRDGGAFSLVFEGPPTNEAKQGVFRLRHDNVGSIDIFLVPVGETPRGLIYQAVFN